MTAKNDLKDLIRERMAKTGESFTAARVRVLAARQGPHREEPQAAVRSVSSATGTRPDPKTRLVRLYNSDDKAPIAGLRIGEIDVLAYWNRDLEFLVAVNDPECGPYTDCRISRPADVPAFIKKDFRELTSWEREESIGGIEDYTEGWKHSDW